MNVIADAIPYIERMILKEESHLVNLKSTLSKAKTKFFPSSKEIELIESYIVRSESSLTHLKLRILQYSSELTK